MIKKVKPENKIFVYSFGKSYVLIALTLTVDFAQYKEFLVNIYAFYLWIHFDFLYSDPVNPNSNPVSPTSNPVNPTSNPVNPNPDPVNPNLDPVNPNSDPHLRCCNHHN